MKRERTRGFYVVVSDPEGAKINHSETWVPITTRLFVTANGMYGSENLQRKVSDWDRLKERLVTESRGKHGSLTWEREF